MEIASGKSWITRAMIDNLKEGRKSKITDYKNIDSSIINREKLTGPKM